jgi:hypothetical protein
MMMRRMLEVLGLAIALMAGGVASGGGRDERSTPPPQPAEGPGAADYP